MNRRSFLKFASAGIASIPLLSLPIRSSTPLPIKEIKTVPLGGAPIENNYIYVLAAENVQKGSLLTWDNPNAATVRTMRKSKSENFVGVAVGNIRKGWYGYVQVQGSCRVRMETRK